MKLRVALYTDLIITIRIRNICSLESMTLKVRHHSSTASGLSSQCSRNCLSGRINICLLFGLHVDPSSTSARIIMSCTVSPATCRDFSVQAVYCMQLTPGILRPQHKKSTRQFRQLGMKLYGWYAAVPKSVILS